MAEGELICVGLGEVSVFDKLCFVVMESTGLLVVERRECVCMCALGTNEAFLTVAIDR